MAESREALRLDLANIPARDRRQVVSNLVQAAVKGEPWAIKELMDRVLGKSIQAVEVKAEEGYLPLVVALPPGVLDPNADAVDGEVVPPQADADSSSLPPPQS